ncbi:MAG: chromate transporter, partial [Clostridiales bacterium]|nr:chromate transporter [Clostridiales bacterium]
GITAVAGGLIAVAGLVLMQKNGFSLENIFVVLITAVLLMTKRIPTPLIVAAALVVGFIL